MLVGLADLIPGISGGTVALLSGIYALFLRTFSQISFSNAWLLLTGRWKKLVKQLPLFFALPFFLGIGSSIILFSKVINLLIRSPQYYFLIYALFMGLILGSFFIFLRQISFKQISSFIFLLLGFMCGLYLTLYTYLNPHQTNSEYSIKLTHEQIAALPQTENLSNYRPETHSVVINKQEAQYLLNKNQISPQQLTPTLLKTSAKDTFFYPFVIFSGLIAAFAMILPGISGSYILHLVGMYPIIIHALASLTTGGNNFFYSLIILANLLIGILIGLGLGSSCITYLLKRWANSSLAILCGLILGGSFSLWPFQHIELSLDTIDLNSITYSIVAFRWPQLPQDLTPLAIAIAGLSLPLIIHRCVKINNT